MGLQLFLTASILFTIGLCSSDTESMATVENDTITQEATSSPAIKLTDDKEYFKEYKSIYNYLDFEKSISSKDFKALFCLEKGLDKKFEKLVCVLLDEFISYVELKYSAYLLNICKNTFMNPDYLSMIKQYPENYVGRSSYVKIEYKEDLGFIEFELLRLELLIHAIYRNKFKRSGIHSVNFDKFTVTIDIPSNVYNKTDYPLIKDMIAHANYPVFFSDSAIQYAKGIGKYYYYLADRGLSTASVEDMNSDMIEEIESIACQYGRKIERIVWYLIKENDYDAYIRWLKE